MPPAIKYGINANVNCSPDVSFLWYLINNNILNVKVTWSFFLLRRKGIFLLTRSEKRSFTSIYLSSMTVDIHHLTNDPTSAWQEISKSQRVIKITMKPPNPEIPANKVRVVCMSDTHSLTPHIKFDVPDGDIFIHAGDFTKCGKREEVIEFNTWIGRSNSIGFRCMSKNSQIHSCNSRSTVTQTQISHCWKSWAEFR